MKNFIKVLVLVMAALMILSAFVACNKDKDEKNENNEEQQADAAQRTMDSILEKANKDKDEGNIEFTVNTYEYDAPDETGLKRFMLFDTDYGSVTVYEYDSVESAKAAYEANKISIENFTDDSDTETYRDGNIVIMGDADGIAHIW